MASGRDSIDAFGAEFARYRALAEGATSQLTFEQLRVARTNETNSIAVIMKHIAGNLRSRWTEPFTSDGEKPWRNRDTEFVDDFADRPSLEAWWFAGWSAVESALAACSDAELSRTLLIRGEPHTLARALARSVAHTAYHVGQVTLLARREAELAGTPWSVLTVPRGGSQRHNLNMGYRPSDGSAAHANG